VIELEKTKDILAGRKEKSVLIGFAQKMKNAEKKKKLDLIVLNSLRDDGAGFGESNKVTFIDKNFNIEPMELKSKEVADDILIK
jgi:phosphopantothenoylcysteine decarboxylase/phosphopantothenate--cysteine ligase